MFTVYQDVCLNAIVWAVCVMLLRLVLSFIPFMSLYIYTCNVNDLKDSSSISILQIGQILSAGFLNGLE